MFDLSYAEIRKQLSFCEALILIENVNQKTTLTGLIARLSQLSDNTTDSRLLQDLAGLLFKLKDLSPAVFAQLKQDTLLGQVLFPPDYTIGKFG